MRLYLKQHHQSQPSFLALQTPFRPQKRQERTIFEQRYHKRMVFFREGLWFRFFKVKQCVCSYFRSQGFPSGQYLTSLTDWQLKKSSKQENFPSFLSPFDLPYQIEKKHKTSYRPQAFIFSTAKSTQLISPSTVTQIYFSPCFLIYIKRGNTLQQIQQFFVQSTNMHIQITYSLFRDEQLSLFGEQDDHYQNQVDLLMDKQRIAMSSTIQNSIYEMEEILNHFTHDSPLPKEDTITGSNLVLQAENRQGDQRTEEDNSHKKNKKIKKASNSPFHNYQKHLNNALKKLIIVPEFQANDENYKSAAIDIWNAYLKSEIKTKRILHFVFNERNQHAINDPQLKNYGLWNIYQSYTEDTISQAKTYLSKLAIDQLDDQNIEGYLKTRKLKSKLGFKEYIVSFKSELEGGYLKRRINIDKALI